MSEQGIMTLQERHEQVKGYLGKSVTIGIDRPLGYVHHKGEKTLVYPINYGYIPAVLGGDGEELDVFLLGVDTPVQTFTGRIIGIVFRADDVEDKLVMAPEGKTFSAEEIARAVYFQEKYYRTTIRSIDGTEAKISDFDK
jgi:inorganic pyrophosphatase